MLEKLLEEIVAKVVFVGAHEAIDWAIKEIKLQSKGRDTGFAATHTFPKSHVGYVLIRLRDLKKNTEIVIIWGPWVSRFVLNENPEQYLLLKKGADAVPLTVLSIGKLSVDFIHQVTNLDDKWK